jgi:hypothetical protein
MTPVILCKPHPEARVFPAALYSKHDGERRADNGQFNSYKLSWGAIAGIALFSALYFADMFPKAIENVFGSTSYLLPTFVAYPVSKLPGRRSRVGLTSIRLCFTCSRGCTAALRERLDCDTYTGNATVRWIAQLSYALYL